MKARMLLPLLLTGCTANPMAFAPPFVTLACERLKDTPPPTVADMTGPVQPYTEFVCGTNGWEIRAVQGEYDYTQVPVLNDRDGDGDVDLADFAAGQRN